MYQKLIIIGKLGSTINSGGGHSFIQTLSKILLDKDIDVIFFNYTNTKKKINDLDFTKNIKFSLKNIVIRKQPIIANFYDDFIFLFKTFFQLFKLRDHIFIFDQPSYVFFLTFFLKKKVVFIHDDNKKAKLEFFKISSKHFFKRIIERFILYKFKNGLLLNKKNLILFNSKFSLKGYAKDKSTFNNYIQNVIYLPVSIDEIPKHKLKSKINLNTNKYFYFISVSHYSKYKNFEKIVEVFNKVSKKDPKIKLILIGRNIKKNLLSQSITISKNIIFTEALKREEIFKIFSQCFCYINYGVETFGYSIVEAMAHGLPIISKDQNSAPSEYIKNNINGFKVTSNEEVIDKIKLLIENKDIYLKLKSNTYKTAEKFSIDSFSKNFFFLLNRFNF